MASVAWHMYVMRPDSADSARWAAICAKDAAAQTAMNLDALLRASLTLLTTVVVVGMLAVLALSILIQLSDALKRR